MDGATSAHYRLSPNAPLRKSPRLAISPRKGCMWGEAKVPLRRSSALARLLGNFDAGTDLLCNI